MAPMNDILPSIINNVKDRATLFSLLTLNKQVFRCTCRVLYKDPFRFFHYKYKISTATKTRFQSLMRLLLSLSPATDIHTNHVRIAFGGQVKQESETESVTTTMADYLSFVHHIHLVKFVNEKNIIFDTSALSDWSPPPGSEQTLESFVRSTLTWCFCSHQLGQMRELEIEPREIDRYTAVASQLCRLRTLAITAFEDIGRGLEDPDVSQTYPSAVRLVQALQQYHGMDMLQDCRFSHPGKSSYECIFQWDVDISKLLPRIPLHDLKLVQPMRSMDSHVLRMKNIMVQMYEYSQWAEISRHYPDMSTGQILQRCRAVTHLEISFPERHNFDSNALAWAVDEARERASGRLLAPPVPLESLNLSLEYGTAEDMGRLLSDGLRGFSQSLRSLTLYLTPFKSDPSRKPVIEDEFFQDESITMRRLEVIKVRNNPELFDYRLLRLCPTLTNLSITQQPYNGPYTPFPSWPILHLPVLEYLDLSCTAIELFDPASLHNSPKLREIRLDYHRTYQTERTSPDRWTWDWDLPELTNLAVTWYFSASTISLKRLHSYPKLQFLSFWNTKNSDQRSYPLEIASVLTSPTQDVFPNLQELHLGFDFKPQPEDLQVLLGRALPRLKRLTLGDLSPCDQEKLVELSRQHSSLESVSFGYSYVSLTLKEKFKYLYPRYGDPGEPIGERRSFLFDRKDM